MKIKKEIEKEIKCHSEVNAYFVLSAWKCIQKKKSRKID
jgi:hypothetical protein